MNAIESISVFEKHEIERQADMCEPLKAELEATPDMAEDVYAALYKTKPVLVDRDVLPSGVDRGRRDILAAALGTKEWAGLRDFTARNAFLAAQSTPDVIEDTMTDLHDNQDYQQAIKDRQEYEDLIRSMQEADPNDPVDIPASWAEYEEELQDQARRHERQAIRHAATRAEDKCEELSEAMSTWGLDDGLDVGINPAEFKAITQAITSSPKLQQIARLAGRMERLALATHESRSTEQHQVIVDVAPGDDLTHMLPTELVSLAEERLRPAFIRRLMEKQLLCYKMEGTEPLGRGPIVLLYDGSGSMSGQREIFAKALVFGLLAIAAKDRRDVIVYEFSSENQCKHWDYPQGRKDPISLVDMATHFFGGGTDPSKALRYAIDAIQHSMEDKGDMIFISDGEFSVTSATLDFILEAKAQRGVRLMTIGMGSCKVQSLDSVADDQLTLYDVLDSQEVTHACFSV